MDSIFLKWTYFGEPNLTTILLWCLESGSVCGWDSAQSGSKCLTHREVEQSGSGRILWLPMWKHQRHNAASNGQQILLDFQKYVLFFTCLWRGYLPTCRNVLLGVCMTYHFCLEYVCMKFGSRTDWWNRGLILFFSLLSTMRLDVDMAKRRETQALTKIDDIDLWFETNDDLGGWNILLMIIRIFFGAWIEQLPPS